MSFALHSGSISGCVFLPGELVGLVVELVDELVAELVAGLIWLSYYLVI